ncbi:unnamed protein product [Calypogeia fissa]
MAVTMNGALSVPMLLEHLKYCSSSPKTSHQLSSLVWRGLARRSRRALSASSLSVASSSQALRAKVGDVVQQYKQSDSTNLQETQEEALETVDPEFYRMGFIRYVRAYGVEFKEGPKGIGVYAAKDMKITKTGRVIMEIPMELMITVSKELPWMFFPDIVPVGHPIFETINSTDPETGWDLRLACLLLLALDQNENFWQVYSEYLPGSEEMTSPIFATEDILHELQDEDLEVVISSQKKRAFDFWAQHWTGDVILKLKRLAKDPSHFLWALGVVWSRRFFMTMTIGSKVQDAHMLIPYADMLNHSYHATCSYRWRKRDRMLEVVMNPGQTVRQGDEMTLNYAHSMPSELFMQYYGFSSSKNPFEVVKFSGKAKIHRESFLSAFNLSDISKDVSYTGPEEDERGVIDGAVLAAARALPTWSEEDLPFLPSQEIKAARNLKQECKQLLQTFPTTLDEDRFIYDSCTDPRLQAAVKYRMHRKILIRTIMETLDLYIQRIIY